MSLRVYWMHNKSINNRSMLVDLVVLFFSLVSEQGFYRANHHLSTPFWASVMKWERNYFLTKFYSWIWGLLLRANLNHLAALMQTFSYILVFYKTPSFLSKNCGFKALQIFCFGRTLSRAWCGPFISNMMRQRNPFRLRMAWLWRHSLPLNKANVSR